MARTQGWGAPPGALRPGPRLLRPVVGGMLVGALGGAALAVLPTVPARALVDPTRPQATVTRGPSCVPGGLELRVQAGTVAVHVVLATTRHPEGEDAADLPAGGTALLHTGDVAWGETVDSRLVSTPADGSGQTWVDELDDWTLTRPTEGDCLIAEAVPSGAPPPGPDGSGPAGTAAPSAVVTDGAAGSDGAASRAVGAGRPITVTGRGFTPGEPVSARLDGAASVLAHGKAGADGTVALRLTVPARARGATRLDLSGATSGSATRLELQVAALRSPLPAPAGDGPALPPLVALVCLTATRGGLLPVARRSATLRRGALPSGSAGAPGGARWGCAPVGARDGARHPR